MWETSAGKRVAVGCQAELTTLRVGGHDYWTIGLESFGPPDRQRDAILECAKRVLPPLSIHRGTALASTGTMGYPEWIERNFHRPPAAAQVDTQ